MLKWNECYGNVSVTLLQALGGVLGDRDGMSDSTLEFSRAFAGCINSASKK